MLEKLYIFLWLLLKVLVVKQMISLYNRSTIRKKIYFLKLRIFNKTMTLYKPDCSLTVHWDDKILPDIINNDNFNEVKKLFGIPKFIFGTREAMANIFVDTLFNWIITDSIQSLSFNTTHGILITHVI